ncbi:hypothetical protein N657DRAFT_582150 [Parathielavia appendiculata]|uniref:Uncharacterized protein n=1 Tax=Parathielavia appendiculata TaxID=2587402 RepID=A0AAN6Z082_9PEZI|nr:hypothetical protein N657DRAFT_582150 [Parathielavia appendiculata]
MPRNPPNTVGISRATLPSPFLRKAAVISFLPALPLCIVHGVLSHDVVPALGLIPLFFSAVVSIFLLLVGRRRRRALPEAKGKGRQTGGVDEDLEGSVVGRGGDVSEREVVEGAEREPSGIEADVDGEDEEESLGHSVLTHRIVVFVADVVFASALMVVLVFTWIRTGRAGDRRPQLAMLAAYSTVPLLVNFLIHLYLAAREFATGMAISGLIEYTAWRAVPSDCPHCGSRLRPDSLPPIPWYETVSRPKVSLPQIKAPSIPRPALPAFKMPKFSALKCRVWKGPNWMRGQNQEYARLFVDEQQNEHDRYSDDPDGPFGEQSGSTTVVPKGSSAAPPVEEIVVGKKERRGKSSSPALFGQNDDASWP